VAESGDEKLTPPALAAVSSELRASGPTVNTVAKSAAAGIMVAMFWGRA
jgi:hypothetical protein